MKLGPNPLPPEQDVEQRLARLRAIGQPVESSPPTQLSNMPPVRFLYSIVGREGWSYFPNHLAQFFMFYSGQNIFV